MILCLDVGNSQIYGGIFDKDEIKFRFRKTSKSGASSDEIGLFLKSVLRENDINPNDIKQISICTVVPEALHSLRNACLKYFKITPFILQPGVKTGLKIKYKNPLEVGADRITNSIAATQAYPDKNIIIVDFGTATTFCAVTKNNEYLGGAILPGLKISMAALEEKTSKLPSVEIKKPVLTLGSSTVESIQSGLYHGHVGAMKEIINNITQEGFKGEAPIVIGTGGFTSLFRSEQIFHHEHPDLVLNGLFLATKMNS